MRNHRFGTCAAALALAGIAVLATNPAAQASSVGPAAPGCPSSRQPIPAQGSITIIGDVGTGVVHLADGTCAHGTYDVILQPGQDTYHRLHWNEAAAAYIGPGYYALYYWTRPPSVTYAIIGPDYVSNMDGGDVVVQAFKS